MSQIESEFSVFLHNGETAIGAVREVPMGGQVIRIYVENAGEFDVSARAVQYAGDGKVVLDPKHLSGALLAAIGHAHDAEDARAADRGEDDEAEREEEL